MSLCVTRVTYCCGIDIIADFIVESCFQVEESVSQQLCDF